MAQHGENIANFRLYHWVDLKCWSLQSSPWGNIGQCRTQHGETIRHGKAQCGQYWSLRG